jgi:plasmid maintenance system antidote protein VapI
MAVKRECKGVAPRLVIRSGLAARGLTTTDVARELRVSRTMVCAVVNGVKRSRRVEAALARHCGFPARELFPTKHTKRR